MLRQTIALLGIQRHPKRMQALRSLTYRRDHPHIGTGNAASTPRKRSRSKQESGSSEVAASNATPSATETLQEENFARRLRKRNSGISSSLSAETGGMTWPIRISIKDPAPPAAAEQRRIRSEEHTS